MNPGDGAAGISAGRSARLLIERHLGLAWVSGEISNFTRAASGHCYFNAQGRAGAGALRALPATGAALDVRAAGTAPVEVRATPTIYEARGEFQLNVDNVRLAGLGALYEQFARLKAQARGRRLVRGRTQARAAGRSRAPSASSRRRRPPRCATSSPRWRRRLPVVPVILYPDAGARCRRRRRDRRGHCRRRTSGPKSTC